MSSQEFSEQLTFLLLQFKKELSCYEDYVSDRLKHILSALEKLLSPLDMESKKMVMKEIRGLIKEEHIYVSVYLYSFLLHMTQEEQDLLTCFKCIEKTDKLSAYSKYFLYYQLKIYMFLVVDLDTDKARVSKWSLFHQIYNEFRKKISAPLTYIPEKDRNKNLVVMITEQMLNDRIGPTRTAMERSASIVQDWKKNILLISTAEAASLIGEINFYEGKVGNYLEEWRQRDFIEWNGVKIPFFQCDNNMPDAEVMDMLLLQIRQLSPMYVITLGGSSVLANMVNEMIPVLTIGLGFSELEPTQTMYQSLCRKMRESDRNLIEAAGMAEEHVIETTFTFDLKNSSVVFTRTEMGVPEEKFILAVVGTRLDMEISSDFLEMLDRLCATDDYYVVFAGVFDTYQEKLRNLKNISSQSKFCGYQNDMLAFLGMCDLFVNPIRKGGGTTAVEAMIQGLPVVTTPYGDIAADVGENFWVKDYEEMYERIQYYHTDREYYMIRSQEAEKIAKYLTEDKSAFIDLLVEYGNRMHKFDMEISKSREFLEEWEV
ncbi:MAG: glycosyltransferase family 4 protein [Roseburia sp.]|nr:glycosyltransferase family 4 protein [Roseburia sp.]